ncbi:MAG: SDR family oxidoreductase [Defluviitaleaceae bacterium]|nr:SDR family oxidoreductase [Defluviitaleaceae bacterium]
MKILFIGGTGRISASITSLCVKMGFEVYLLNRGKRIPKGLEGAIHLAGDIGDEAQVAALLKGHKFDVVANFICFVPEQVERDIRLFSGITEQYVFISSASAYQKPLSCYRITESTPLANPFWEYSRNKIACEERLIKEYREKGFPVTIVRPSHTYDKTAVPIGVHGKNGPWQVLKRMQEGKPVIVHGDGESLWVLTHSIDFAKGFVGLMGNIHAIGESVHITSDEVLTWNQIHKLIARELRVEPKLFYVPSGVLATEGIAYDYDFNGSLWGDKANSVVFDNSKIKSLVPDFNATIRFDMGIRESVANFLATPELQQEDSDFDKFTDGIVQKSKSGEI